MSRLTDLLALTYVPRWSIVPMLRTQSVAEHSHRVAVIALELEARLMWGGHPMEWAVIHDAPEARSGDIPHTFKSSLAGLEDAEYGALDWSYNTTPNAPFDTSDKHIVKMADLIEAYTWLMAWGLGAHANRVTPKIYKQLWDYVHATYTGEVWAVVDKVITEILDEVGR